MATTPKKRSKNTKAKPRRPMVNTLVAEQTQTIAELRQELQDCKRQLTESLEQQTTTSEILRVIASSPTDLQPVLDAVAENAARLCESIDAQIFRLEGNILRRGAVFGGISAGKIGGEDCRGRGAAWGAGGRGATRNPRQRQG